MNEYMKNGWVQAGCFVLFVALLSFVLSLFNLWQPEVLMLVFAAVCLLFAVLIYLYDKHSKDALIAAAFSAVLGLLMISIEIYDMSKSSKSFEFNSREVSSSESANEIAAVEEAPVAEAPIEEVKDNGIKPGEYDFTGEIDGRYPIHVFMEVDRDRNITGKYYYQSVYESNGDVPSSYMYFDGYVKEDGRSMYLSVNTYDNPEKIETWNLDLENDYSMQATGEIFNSVLGKTFKVALYD